MAIDTAEKRFSIVDLSSPWRVQTVVPSGTVDESERAHFIFMYAGISLIAAIPPADRDDQDNAGNTLTITSFVDGDGATLRPPRLTLLHSFDDARNAALTGPERLDMDRHTARGFRLGRQTNTGDSLRLFAFTSRAGEVPAIRSIVLTVSPVPRRQRLLAADTTSRTARDGTSLVVPTVQVMHAADSSRNSDLRVIASEQDRTSTRHAISSAISRQGRSHRLMVMGLGRAGSAGPAVRKIVLTVVPVPPGPRVKARST
jgi:hypothetical protein